jgi:nucleoside 2-deoxyribosyltransferase
MRLFLATSFSGQTTPDGKVHESFRRDVEAIINGLLNAGHSVFCAVQAEGWDVNTLRPEQAFEMDLRELNEADAFIGFVTANPPSAGVQFEIGYSLAKGKRVVLMRHESDKLPYMNIGLVNSGNAIELQYESMDDLMQQLKSELSR